MKIRHTKYALHLTIVCKHRANIFGYIVCLIPVASRPTYILVDDAYPLRYNIRI